MTFPVHINGRFFRSIKLILALLVLAGAASAQYESRKAYAGFSIGPSLVQGVFAENDIMAEEAGFAKDGVAFNLHFAYRLGSNFGITAMYMFQSNSFDDNAFLNGLKSIYGTSGPVIFTDIDSDPWVFSGLSGGLFASIPLESLGKLILEPRAFVSLFTAISPRIKITGKDGQFTTNVEQQATAGAAFGFILGGGLRYNLSDRTALLLNADYVKTTPKFFDVERWSSNGVVSKKNLKQKVEAVNVCIGFAIRFRKDMPPVRRATMRPANN
jgi:hypothetical protein